MANKLVCMLRVKDGILFINKWLSVMEKLVDEIVVVDNGSTDGTLEIMQAHPKVVDIAQTVGFDEGRDKIMVYEMARKRKPDWCIWLDVDEIFEDRITRSDMERMMRSRIIKRYGFRRFHFFGDINNYEASKEALQELARPSRTMWKETPQAYFRNEKIHNGDVQGITKLFVISKFRLKHITNLNVEYRKKVYENYIKIDPSRKEMYEKHKDNLINQSVPTRTWYEYKEKPLSVTLQFLFLNLNFVFIVLKKKIKF